MNSPDMQIMIFTITSLVILLTFVYWTIIFFVKKRLDVSRVPTNTIPSLSKAVAWIIMLLIVVFYLGVSVVFSNPFEVVYGIPGSLKTLLIIPFIVILLVLLMTVLTWNIWREGETRIFSRIWYTLLWLCMLATIWQWNYWNFLGWKY
jgi:hypothetical protein